MTHLKNPNKILVLFNKSQMHSMKRSLPTLILILLISLVSKTQAQTYPLGNDTVLCGGQSITLNPFTNAVIFEDSLVVTYNATLGQSGLIGANKVYMHAGYQEAAFGPISGWVGNWGLDDGVGEMRSLGNNFWRITIHVRNYFSIPIGVNVNALAMVFRNADGTQTGKDDNGNDIFLVISTPPPTSAFSGVSGFIKRDNIETILWSNGAVSPSITVNTSGNFSFVVTDTAGVSYSDDIIITYTSAQLNLGNDISLCGSSTITLDAGSGFTNYNWNTGANTQSISVNTPGVYYVTAQIGNCTASDTIVVNNNIPNLGSINLGNDTVICGNIAFSLDAGIAITPFGDSLTVVYDATQGQTQLVGANKVYFHSGYQLVPFGPIIGWVGNWGQDDGLGQMTNIGTDLWKITVNVNSYYGLASNSNVNALAMVFRSADGTQTGKDNNGNDIYLTVETNPVSAFGGVTGTYSQSPYTSLLWSTGDTTNTISISTSGLYSIEVNTSVGCVLRDTIEVSLGNLPFVDAGSSQEICVGENLVLNAGNGFASYQWSTGDTTAAITVNTAGTYIINVTNNVGCTGADVINIAVLPAPVAMFTYNVNSNGIINFTSTSTNSSTFAWDFNNDGNTDASTPTPFYTYINPGTYNVRLIVTNDCGSDTIILPVNSVSSIGEVDHQKTFVVYPNPSSDFINIQASQLNQSASISYEICDVIGKQLIIGTINNPSIPQRIAIGNLPSGIYFVRLHDSEKSYIKKFNKL
jgi:PKD repeat protein